MKLNKINKLYIILFIIILIFFYNYSLQNNIIKKNENNTIEIIISRFNEDLKWTLIAPFNKYKYIVYNKGDDEDFEKSNVTQSYNIKNQGKCDHTYLYHIYHNYSNLKDITVFLPGCINENYFKYEKSKLLLKLIEKYNSAIYICEYTTNNNIQKDFYNFTMDSYKSISKKNLLKQIDDYKQSTIRPFGKWYEKHFNFNIKQITLFGILSIDKKDIYNNNKYFYFKLMKELEGSTNNEQGHYFERSWVAIFYPIKNTYLLNYNNLFEKAISKLVPYNNQNINENSLILKIAPIFYNINYFINKYLLHF